ncbi:rhodanese-like domain-containing protein [Dactylosporangium sp. CA-139114]|uniref:rhodanese-like domain-containing protein n=1 Tax=Dactylosporangium sp. CA-139114 TaxID=3239931 RepID=UPI003D983A5E
MLPGEAHRRVEGGAVLVDVRSAPRRDSDGTIPGARVLDRTRVAAEIGIDGPDTPIVVICGSVNGSQPVAEELIGLGYTDVVHVEGGFAAWAEAGLPTVPGRNA